MTETLANVISLLGLATTFLAAALGILVLSLAYKIQKETRK